MLWSIPPIRRVLRAMCAVCALGSAALAFAVFVWPTYHWRPEQPYYSGILVLDLKGDGLDLHGMKPYTSYFPHEGDWFFQATGWPNGGHDGILALAQTDDENIDGLRDLVAVLPTELLQGASAFDKLAAFDANGDGLVDANDPDFGRLMIWIDRDADGLTDPGDLVTPEAAGVRALRVAHGGGSADIAGNKIFAVGAFIGTDGSTRKMSEVGFGYDHLMTFDAEPATVPGPIMIMPAMRGYGKTRGLRLTMNRDFELFKLVQRLSYWFGYQGNTLAPADLTSRIQEIVTQWSEATDVAPDSRGPYLDARHLATLEHIRGVSYF